MKKSKIIEQLERDLDNVYYQLWIETSNKLLLQTRYNILLSELISIQQSTKDKTTIKIITAVLLRDEWDQEVHNWILQKQIDFSKNNDNKNDKEQNNCL